MGTPQKPRSVAVTRRNAWIETPDVTSRSWKTQPTKPVCLVAPSWTDILKVSPDMYVSPVWYSKGNLNLYWNLSKNAKDDSIMPSKIFDSCDSLSRLSNLHSPPTLSSALEPLIFHVDSILFPWWLYLSQHFSILFSSVTRTLCKVQAGNGQCSR